MNKRQKKKHGISGRRRIEVEQGSGNVFADLGLPDAKRRLADAERQSRADLDLPVSERARRAESRIKRLQKKK